MRIVIVNKSDGRGGAAVVSFRLMQALRDLGIDARMIVEEKLLDSPYIALASSRVAMRYNFLAERMKIFLRNGFSRATLFQIDTLSDGIDIASHPWMKDADVVMLNWVNQGLLSASGIRRLVRPGRKIIWTMHDMWCLTGICHHAHSCSRYKGDCNDCPLLSPPLACKRMAGEVWRKKKKLYDDISAVFVPVSRWLGECARQSSLLKEARVEVIPNPFPFSSEPQRRPEGKKVILFGAARLDDPIKDIATFKRAVALLVAAHPELKEEVRVVTFGGVKNPQALEGFEVESEHLGTISGAEVKRAYSGATIVVSSSSFETLPGTLVEGQAYGAVPVAFRRGGQEDIVESGVTGFLTAWDEDRERRSRNLADAIYLAFRSANDEMREKMYHSAVDKFSAESVARHYLKLIQNM